MPTAVVVVYNANTEREREIMQVHSAVLSENFHENLITRYALWTFRRVNVVYAWVTCSVYCDVLHDRNFYRDRCKSLKCHSPRDLSAAEGPYKTNYQSPSRSELPLGRPTATADLVWGSRRFIFDILIMYNSWIRTSIDGYQ